MIITKLLEIEADLTNGANKEPNKLMALQAIKNLLEQIDFSAEVVPLHNENQIIQLFVSLKGEQLSQDEVQIAKKLITDTDENKL